MCRLFGFRSSMDVGVHHSLVLAENALAMQSQKHPDGWGIGYYESDLPVLRRSAESAFVDRDFRQMARFVRSPTVIAHIRAATIGRIAIENAHPFQMGRWIFAHNGTVQNFESIEEEVLAGIAPDLRVHIAGNTDSERMFYLFLSFLRRSGVEYHEQAPANLAAEVLGQTVTWITKLATRKDCPPPILNFLVTDGRAMAASRLGRSLFFSTQKRFCGKMEECSKWQQGAALPCMNPLRETEINHILIASESISADDVWEEVEEGEVLAIDADFAFRRHRVMSESHEELSVRYEPYAMTV